MVPHKSQWPITGGDHWFPKGDLTSGKEIGWGPEDRAGGSLRNGCSKMVQREQCLRWEGPFDLLISFCRYKHQNTTLWMVLRLARISVAPFAVENSG